MNDYKEKTLPIGKAIQYWRIIMGFKQKDISKLLVTKRSYIAKLEGGYVGISVKRIIEISNILGVSDITLMRGLPSEKALRVIENIYQDIKLNITSWEHEALWNLDIYKGNDITLENYQNYLIFVRSTVEGN